MSTDGRGRGRLALRAAVALAAAAAIGVAWWWLVGRRAPGALEWAIRDRRLVVPHPAWLAALATLPWLWLVLGTSLADLPRAQQWISLFVRAGIVTAIVAALTGAAWIGRDDRVCTIAVVDVSDSMSDEALARARAYVDDVRHAAGPRDAFRLVTFAATPRAVALPPDPSAPLPAGAIARPIEPGSGAETDVQAALRFAYGLFPPHHLGRLVVVSDGAETRGAMLGEADAAAALGLHVYTRSFPGLERAEVAIRAVHMPPRPRLRAPFEVAIDVFATAASAPGTPATIVVHKDGLLDHRETIALGAGDNTIRYETTVYEAGVARFEVALDPGVGAADTFPANNHFVATALVRGKPQVLYVEGTPAFAVPLRRALEAAGLAVEVRGPNGVPDTLAELARFDAVILSDVAASYVSHAAQGALEAFVRDAGGGLVLAGGDQAFGPGGWRGTRLERIFPVSLDVEKRRDTPSIAIVLVIDKSGSKAGTKIELAKDAAKAVVERLGPSDQIGVIAFDTAPREIVKLTRALNRTKIMEDIARLADGGGTLIYPALNKAYEDLRSTTAAVKHVILLSDGQTKEDRIVELVATMQAAGITVSAVGIGDGIDRPLMEAIAREGSGRFHHTSDPYNIPAIFVKETDTVARSALAERPVRARVVKDLSLVRGVPFAAAPDLLGYVATTARPGAELALSIAETGEPLLATWRVGLGKVTAWTSDVKPRWSAGWMGWSGFGKLWAQILRDTMRHGTPERWDAIAEVIDGRVHVVVDAVGDDDAFVNGLAPRARLYDPADPKRSVELDLAQSAAGRYEGTLVPPGLGAYVVEVTHRRGDDVVVATSRTTVSLPYPRETLTLAGDHTRLAKLATLAGGVADAEPSAPWAPAGEEITTLSPVWPWIALVALALFVLDVMLRRVRWWDRPRPAKPRAVPRVAG